MTDRSERAAVVLAAALVSLPGLVARLPPMTDLPLQMAEVGLMLHLHDPRFVPPGLYQSNFGHPNQLFHLASYLLALVVGVDWGCKLVVAAAQAGMIFAGARLAKHLGASAWCALLLAPICLGWIFHFGLVANLVGMALFLAALPSLDRLTATPTWKHALTAGAWLFLLYMAHESVLVIAALAVVVFTLSFGLRQQVRLAALRMAPAAFALLLVATQFIVQKHFFQAAGDAGGQVEWRSPLTNIGDLPFCLSGLPDDAINLALFVLTFLAVAAFALPSRGTSLSPIPRRYLVVALICFAATLFFPFGIAHGTLFNQRFFYPAFALGGVALAVRGSAAQTTWAQRILASAVVLAFVAVTTPELVDCDRQNRDLDSLLTQVEPGSAIAYIEADPNKGGRSYAVSTLAARTVAERGGRAMRSFADSPIAPVVMSPAHYWPDSQRRMTNNTVDFAPAHDLLMYRYVFVHSYNAAILAVTPAIFAEAKPLGQAGEWALFESKLDVIALTDPEPPWPDEEPETFRIRAIRQLRALSLRQR